jgi:hypothetical protein
MTNTTQGLGKAGKAYYASLNVGQMWVKRIGSTWHVVYTYTDPNGDRQWSTLATHVTKANALRDAEALIAAI